VALKQIRISDFRCLNGVVLDAHPDFNLITGKNAAGKTSLLEAIYFLGRGKSFRGVTSSELIGTGRDNLTLFALVEAPAGDTKLGVDVSRGTKQIRQDGENAKTADLAAAFPVQAIDPEIHELIQGGPEKRRRFVDWGVFHVEHSYIDTWRAYKTALKQRNAALRSGQSTKMVEVWDEQLVSSGNSLDMLRKSYLDSFMSRLSSILNDIQPYELKIAYHQGWKDDVSLAEALNASRDRDRVLQATQVGPHRGDLKLRIDGRGAKHRLSRGQQKLLGAAMVIAQTHFVAEALDRRVVLLVDDPAAELDDEHQQHLHELLAGVPAQLFVTSLNTADTELNKAGKSFCIEAGEVSALL